MSTPLSLKAALEQRVAVVAKGPDQSGSPAAVILRADHETGISRPVDVVRVLTHHGLKLDKAHNTLERLARGQTASVEMPSVADLSALIRRLDELGVRCHERRAPVEVDIPRIRAGLGLTQREFALRYQIELATLRNWEQRRTPLDPRTRLLLRIIERHPEIVDEVMEAAGF